MQTASLNSAPCTDIVISFVGGSRCKGRLHHEYGEACPYADGPMGATQGQLNISIQSCGGGGHGVGYGGSIPTINPVYSDNYGGGGGSPNQDMTTPVFTVVTMSPERQRKKQFSMQLDESIKDCVQNGGITEDAYGEVLLFLESFDGELESLATSYPEEYTAFAEAVLTAKCDNPEAEVDFEDRIIIDIAEIVKSKFLKKHLMLIIF